MERRKAIKTAAAASLTLLAGAAGIAINSGIVGASGEKQVGTLSPVSSGANTPVAVPVDSGPYNTVPSVPAIRPTTAAPVTRSSASGYRASGGHDDGEHSYEGAEDDD